MSGKLLMDLEWKLDSLKGQNNNGDNLSYIIMVLNQPRSISTLHFSQGYSNRKKTKE